MTDLDELERLAREAGREMGLTDLRVLRVSERGVGWMVRLPDGTAFRGCAEEESEPRAWEEMGRTLRDLGTSTRLYRDRADRAEAELKALRERVEAELTTYNPACGGVPRMWVEARRIRAELWAKP